MKPLRIAARSRAQAPAGRNWIGFWLLSLIRGSSYLFIRIGVAEMPPFQLVFIRTLIAAAGLTVVAYLRRRRPPTDRRGAVDMVFLGLVHTTVPFALITWGETRIESSLASILQGTTALFTFFVAHLAFADERATPGKQAGLGIGFLGVVVLAGRSTLVAQGGDASSHPLGRLAIVAASSPSVIRSGRYTDAG